MLAANPEPLLKRVRSQQSIFIVLLYQLVTINAGEVPMISVSDRKWNDDSVAVILGLKLPSGVSCS